MLKESTPTELRDSNAWVSEMAGAAGDGKEISIMVDAVTVTVDVVKELPIPGVKIILAPVNDLLAMLKPSPLDELKAELDIVLQRLEGMYKVVASELARHAMYTAVGEAKNKYSDLQLELFRMKNLGEKSDGEAVYRIFLDGLKGNFEATLTQANLFLDNYEQPIPPEDGISLDEFLGTYLFQVAVLQQSFALVGEGAKLIAAFKDANPDLCVEKKWRVNLDAIKIVVEEQGRELADYLNGRFAESWPEYMKPFGTSQAQFIIEAERRRMWYSGGDNNHPGLLVAEGRGQIPFIIVKAPYKFRFGKPDDGENTTLGWNIVGQSPDHRIERMAVGITATEINIGHSKHWYAVSGPEQPLKPNSQLWQVTVLPAKSSLGWFDKPLLRIWQKEEGMIRENWGNFSLEHKDSYARFAVGLTQDG